MKKLILFSALLFSLLISSALSEESPFTLIYWIKGNIPDSTAGSPNGRVIYFANSRATDVIGVAGNSARPNQFLINAGDAHIPLVVGQKYQVFTKNIDGKGLGPYEVTISGKGIEDLGELKYRVGGGFSDIPVTALKTEQAPAMEVWVDGRLYQQERVDKGEKFIISQNPQFEVKFSIPEPYSLSNDFNDYGITIDPGKSSAQSLSVGAKNATSRVMATGIAPTESRIQSLGVNYPKPPSLAGGSHTITIMAKSSGRLGTAGTAIRNITVDIVSGPLRLIGTPIPYPSPFSITRDKTVTIQYQLSANADIDIYVIGADGMRVRHMSFDSGSMGGLAGMNKVSWDGRRDQGGLAGNAIYVGTIISKSENRILGRFMLTFAD